MKFEKYTIANLRTLVDNKFEVYVYYEGEYGGHELHNQNIDISYDNKNIKYIGIYGGWIHITMHRDKGNISEPKFQLREE